jgi:hypothetical protein
LNKEQKIENIREPRFFMDKVDEESISKDNGDKRNNKIKNEDNDYS